MQVRKGLVLLIPVCVAVLVAASWAAFRFTRYSLTYATASELPERVPDSGLTLSLLYGTKTPVPVPLYPGGRVYGSGLDYPNRGRPFPRVAEIVEGAYAKPQAIMQYYRRRWREYDVIVHTDQPDLIILRLETPTGHVYVTAVSDPRGVTKDIRKLFPGDPKRSYYDYTGGDPDETCVWITILWKVPPRQR